MSVTYPTLPAVQPLSTPAELGKLATVLASRSDLWGPLLQFDAQERWFTRFGGGEGWEAWLLTWLPGQRTGLHDHGGSAGAFTVLLGTVREETPHDPAGRTLNAPDLRAFGPEHIHDVVGAGEGPAATLHVYSPTLSVMRRYARTPSGIELTSVEREGSDW